MRLLAGIIEGKEIHSGRMGDEVERARKALTLAREGQAVALVSSGDAGIYGMAGLVYEILAADGADVPAPPIEVIPGITAAAAAGALLGAPLMNDMAVISLSDLLTPWETIAKRLELAAKADLVIALYNPASSKRKGPLEEARRILLRHLDPATPVGVVRRAYREGQQVETADLAGLAEIPVDMQTTIIIGNSTTFRVGEAMVTPRGYDRKYRLGGSGPDGSGSRASAADLSAGSGSPDGGSAVRSGSSEGSAAPPQTPDGGPATYEPIRDPAGISRRSFEIIRGHLGILPLSEAERAVVERIVHTSGDLGLARAVEFQPDAADRGVAALRAGCAVVTDVNMVRVALNGRLMDRFGCRPLCLVADPAVAGEAELTGRTRSAMAVRKLAGEIGGGIVLVGNAPTALEELIDLVEEGTAKPPALVIGIPVGFVGARESKDRLAASGLPYITIRGERGGSPLVAAALNALLLVAAGESQ